MKNIYYGWYIVLAASLITLLTVGMRMSVGPFFLPFVHDFHISRTYLSGIVAIGMIVYGIGMPIAGFLEKRYGTRFVLLSGVAIVVLSCFWMIFSRSPLHLLFSFGIMLSFGLAFTSPVALTPVIARSFEKRRGEALFYLATASMAGIAVLNPLFTFLIREYGWQQTIFLFAIVFSFLVVPTALFVIREKPRRTVAVVGKSQSMTAKEAWKTRPFWQICLGLFACGYSMNLIGSHGIPMLVDHGFKEMTASFAIGLIGIVAIVGTLFMGKISDHLPRKNMLAVIYLVRGIGFFFLLFATSPFQLYFIAAIAGLVWAGSNSLSSAILTDIYGVHIVGVLYGWAYFSHQIGAMISSFLGGWGYETFSTHVVSFGSAVVILMIASFISYSLPKKGNDNKLLHQIEGKRA